jgi:hypothetical protein
MKMATRTRKKVTATESIEDLVEKHDNTDEPVLKEIELIEPQVELKENEIQKQKKLDLITPKPIRWKKIGSGGFLFKNHHIKPGQIFTATVEEIPLAFRDVIVPIEDVPTDKLLVNPEILYKKELIEGTNTYNIVSSTGKILNENPVTLEEAEKLLKAF